jgi:hypothetical protein
MPNFTSGFWSRFGKKPGAPANQLNSNLERNVRIFANSYFKNRNSPNKLPPINKYLTNSLHKYMNAKRPRAAGAAAAAVQNAGGSNANAAKAAAGAMKANGATPGALGIAAAAPLLALNAPPAQAAAAAAGAAKQQALALGMGSNAANNVAAKAAARAANQARPNARPVNAAQTAAAGAAAAGLNANAQAAAASISLANSGYPGNANNLRRIIEVNAGMMSKGSKAEALRRLNIILGRSGNKLSPNLKNRANAFRSMIVRNNAPLTRGFGLMRQAAANQTQRPRNNNERTVKAPNGRNVTLIREHKEARWNFKNNANKQKYEIMNRLSNTPEIYEPNFGSYGLAN